MHMHMHMHVHVACAVCFVFLRIHRPVVMYVCLLRARSARSKFAPAVGKSARILEVRGRSVRRFFPDFGTCRSKVEN